MTHFHFGVSVMRLAPNCKHQIWTGFARDQPRLHRPTVKSQFVAHHVQA